MEEIIATHPQFFESLKSFLINWNTVRFIRGNHDVDLIWPGVQECIRKAVNASSAVGELIFEPSHVYRKNGIHLEHGNQYCTANCFKDPDAPFAATTTSPRRLDRCWGTYFVETVVNDFAERYPLINNIPELPQALYLALLEDVPIHSQTAGKRADASITRGASCRPIEKAKRNIGP